MGGSREGREMERMDRRRREKREGEKEIEEGKREVDREKETGVVLASKNSESKVVCFVHLTLF